MTVKQLYSRESVQAIDRMIISRGLPGPSLMQRAGQAAFDVLVAKWPQTKKVLIFCGVGNNAGDGYVLARLLVDANIAVDVVQVGATDKFKSDALTAYNNYLNTNSKPLQWDKNNVYNSQIVVDALFGTGLNSPLHEEYYDVVNYINQQHLPVLSLDIPSGLDANTGLPLGIAVHADVTVTFIAYKKGLFLGEAQQYCGEIVLDELGVNPRDYQEIVP
jgi:NAD(P)H-hydrate epimerase